jgi:hypothetical protein
MLSFSKCGEKKFTVAILPAINLELSGSAVAISQQYPEQYVKVYDDDKLIQLLTFWALFIVLFFTYKQRFGDWTLACSMLYILSVLV